MTIYIAFLRGINVGGHKLIKMADLRQSLEMMGLRNVQTYIQSGNILFESEKEASQLAQRIEQQIQTTFGFFVPVMLRTSVEFEQIMENCPFNFDALLENESIHISLLSEVPTQKEMTHLDKFQNDVEKYRIEGKEIYLFLSQSIRDSKLAIQLQKVGVSSTSRNWKTIIKLATKARAME